MKFVLGMFSLVAMLICGMGGTIASITCVVVPVWAWPLASTFGLAGAYLWLGARIEYHAEREKMRPKSSARPCPGAPGGD